MAMKLSLSRTGCALLSRNIFISEEWRLLVCYSVWLLRTDVSEELSAFINRVIRIRELGTRVFLRSLCRLLITANVVPSSPILVILMMEAQSSSETSVLTRATRVTFQKTPFFIVTAVKTSNLTFIFLSLVLIYV
jgi:hypothetical protein